MKVTKNKSAFNSDKNKSAFNSDNP